MRISDWSSDVCSSDLGRSQGSDRASIARSTKNAERPSISARPTHRHVHGPADRRKLQASNDKGLSGPAEAPDIPDRSRRNITTRSDGGTGGRVGSRSEEHTSELQSLMRISSAVFCLKKTKNEYTQHIDTHREQYREQAT